MPRHSCCEVRVMQLHDILLLRTSAILPEAISAGGLTPTTDTSLFLTIYRGGSHLPADILFQPSYFSFLYSSSLTGSSHSLELFSPGTSIARWLNHSSGAAPCQCFTSAGILMQSPGFISTASFPSS